MINTNEKPRLIIIAGPNGSGKTSVTHRILKHEWVEGCEYINPDNIARDMFGDWNSIEAMMKAARYATEKREKILSDGHNLIFETVLSAPDKIHYIQKAKDKGYFTRLFFICTDNPRINAARIAHRVMTGGHDVPITKIINRYYKAITNCEILVPLVDRLYVYDNSIENEFPKLLFRASEGVLTKEYNPIHDWSKTIYEATL